MSNEIPAQIASKPKVKDVKCSLSDFTTYDLQALDSMDLTLALALAKSQPELKNKIFLKYCLSKGIKPYEDLDFASAGMLDFLTERWTFKANPEMKLLLNLAKFGELTNAPTRAASLQRFQKLEEVKQKHSDDELEDKNIEDEEKVEDGAKQSGLQKAWGTGVGYGSEYTGDDAHWDLLGWNKNSIAQDQEIVKVLNEIIELVAEDFAFDFISESSVIPALLSFCQNDSFHDITSKHQLYTSIFNAILSFVKNAKYLPLLFESHGSTLAERVCILGRQAERVLKLGARCRDAEDDSAQIANLIAEVYKSLTKAVDDVVTALRVSQLLTKDTSDLSSLVSKLESLRVSLDSQGEEPAVDLLKKKNTTNEDYEKIMRELCFGSVDEMCEFRAHHYSREHVRVKRKLMKRLAGEFADFSQSLPIHHESSVFFRFCEEKMSHAQMLIIPADGTPYGGGCFIFDVKFPANYPNSPPKVNLSTTGHGAVRFNPNLYECGKVCLSLLGTWDAYSQGEKWNLEISTFLQVAISIQSLIFVPEPFYNEPGDEDSMGTEWGDQQSRAYNVVIQSGTTKYAMIEVLENPPAAWRDVIETHFNLQGDRALKNVTEWLGAEHDDTKRIAELLTNLRNKIDSSSEEEIETRKIGA